MAKRSEPSGTLPVKPNSALDAQSFGHLLHLLRTQKELSQTDLANQLKRSTSFVSLLETGLRRPTRELIDLLADALGLPDDSDVKRDLIRAAGYEPSELSTIIQRIVDAVTERTHCGEASRLLLSADLAALIDGWTESFKLKKRFDLGYFDEVSKGYQQLLQRRHYSPTLMTYLQMGLAETLVQQGELGRAETLAQEANAGLEALQVAPDWAPTLSPESRAIQGLIFVHNGNYLTGKMLIEQAIAFYQKYLQSNRIPEDAAFIGLGSSYKRLAQVLLLQGEPESALTYCFMAETYLMRADHTEERDHWLRRTAEQKAWAYSKLGDYERAIELRMRTRDEFLKAHDDYGLTRNLLYTGDDYLGRVKAEVKRSLSSMSADKALLVDLGRRTKLIRAALMKPQTDEWLENAEKCYREAQVGLERFGQNTLLGRCLSNLAVVLRYKALLTANDALFESAQEELVRAQTLEQGIGQKRRLPGIYEALGDLAVDRDHLARAKYYYDKGLQELESVIVRSSDIASKGQRERLERALQVVNAHMRRAQRASPQGPAQKSDLALPVSASLERWQEICKRLVKQVLTAVLPVHEAQGPAAYSSRDDAWLAKMRALDHAPGGRMLVQGRLSDSLALRLPAGLSPEGARIHESRYREFSAAVANAVEVSWDLCCRPQVERGLGYPDNVERVREQVQNALKYVDTRGYRLDSSPYETPLDFAVKGSHVLVEIPPALFNLILTPDQAMSPLFVTLCYEFHDEGLARELAQVFHELVVAANDALDQPPKQEPTQQWLAQLIATPVIHPGLTGGAVFAPA